MPERLIYLGKIVGALALLGRLVARRKGRKEMTDQEKHDHDVATAGFQQQRQGMTESQLIDQALATLMLALAVPGHTKYDMQPSDAATYMELMHRAQPSGSF